MLNINIAILTREDLKIDYKSLPSSLLSVKNTKLSKKERSLYHIIVVQENEDIVVLKKTKYYSSDAIIDLLRSSTHKESIPINNKTNQSILTSFCQTKESHYFLSPSPQLTTFREKTIISDDVSQFLSIGAQLRTFTQ